MSSLEEQHLLQLLTKLENVPRSQLQKKFIAYFEKDAGHGCTLEAFAIYYLATLRQSTEQHFRSGETDTPKCETPVRQIKPQPESTTTPEKHNYNESHQLNTSALSSFNQSNASTPVRSTLSHQQGRRSTGQICSTPQSSERANRSVNNSNSFCLADFIVSTPTQSQQRSKKKMTPNQQNITPQDKVTPASKPKRRVLPMTIAKNVSSDLPFGSGTSSFSNENNLWRLSQSSELLDRSQGALLELETRKSLLLHKQDIKTEAFISQLDCERRQSVSQDTGEVEGNNTTALESVDFADIKNIEQLRLLATIYAQLIELNLVPNVLSEICYIVQLLNVSQLAGSVLLPLETDPPFGSFCNVKSCIYFAVQVLEDQRLLLLQLDHKSLCALLQNDRIALLSKTLRTELEFVCQRKQKQQTTQTADLYAGSPSVDSKLNVYYQHDKDSRDNFPSQNEFGAFKAQRDLFYKCFKHWELNHLNRVFNFCAEVTPKIREIFRQSEHPINMAHFAKLFVNQLLISANEATDSPEELGLKLDQLRLNRLAHRLVTSNSSVEDQFPRTQLFFKDFINGCGSVAFIAQLKLALYAQLLRYNDSTFELVQLFFTGTNDSISDAIEPDETALQAMEGPYVVRAPVLASMLILAKFLGYVTALPYNQCVAPLSTSNLQPSTVDIHQLQLRSHFQSDFDANGLLERAMLQGKLLITLPWLVQYLILLDVISLQMANTKAAIQLLYELYIRIGNPRQQLQPNATFLLRSCIGWLLEAQPTLTNNYYLYRTQGSVSLDAVGHCLDSLRINCNSPMRQRAGNQITNNKKTLHQPESMLELLLPVACPFLSEFRVAIAPCKQSQSTSRTGRYRYITTRLEQFTVNQNEKQSIATDDSHKTDSIPSASTPSSLGIPGQEQRKLIDSFLHSQNASMRRLLEFVGERSFKCVVKDAQQNILRPSKADADNQVNAITSTKRKEVYVKMQRIYDQARSQACIDWRKQVPAMVDQRIQQSLHALLPSNTNSVVRNTYALLISNQAHLQLKQWFETNVLQSNFYYGDLHEMSAKVCRANKNNPNTAPANNGLSNELCLNADDEPTLSDLLYDLQKYLHCLSNRPEYLRCQPDLLELLDRVHVAVLQPQLPTTFYYIIGSSLVRLLQLLICHQPTLCTPELMERTCEVWLSPQLLNLNSYRKQTTTDSQSSPCIFDTLLSVNFVNELYGNQSTFSLLKQLLLAMLASDVLQIDQLNELFMPLFKQNWAPQVWTALSQILQQIAQENSGTERTTTTPSSSSAEDDAKSHLFMEALADLSRDLDF